MRLAESIRNPVFLRLSLRTNLLVLLAILAVLVVIDRSREIAKTRDTEIERARADLLALAQDGVERQSALISQIRATLRLAVTLPKLAGTALTDCRASLREIVSDRPWIASLSVIRPNGDPLCTSLDKIVPQNLADRDYFKQALATQSFVVSDYIFSRLTKKPIIVAVMPRLEGGAVTAILAAAIDVQQLNRLAARTAKRSGAEVMLLDRKGTVIAASPNAERWIGRDVAAQSDFWRRVKGPDGHFETSSLEGEKRFVGHVRSPDTGAFLVVTRARSDVLAHADELAKAAVLKIVIFGLLGLLGVWLGGEWFVLRPLDTLTKSAARLGSGDLKTRVSTAGLSPELKLLAETFNGMAAQLSQHEAELQRANLQLSQLAATDGLTGLANRRQFDERIDAEWRRACRSGERIALLMIDVDRFKNFNDRYGHLAGDECLKRVAEVLSNAGRRPGDLSARTGGEEFAILLPTADADDAAVIAESVRAAVEAMGIEHLDSAGGVVTASIGAASLRPRPGSDVRSLINAADAALYRAKRAGRNRVMIDQTPPVALAS